MQTYFLNFRGYRWWSIPVQVVVLGVLFGVTVLYGHYDFARTGLLFGYPYTIRLFFVPLYEELLFRGVLFGGLLKRLSLKWSVTVSSLLFGLWHLKNFPSLSNGELLYQVLYTGTFFGPLMAYVTFKTKSIWPAVMLHFANNLLSSASWDILGLIFSV